MDTYSGILIYTTHSGEIKANGSDDGLEVILEQENTGEITSVEKRNTLSRKKLKYFFKSYIYIGLLCIFFISIAFLGYRNYSINNMYTTGTYEVYRSNQVITIDPPVENAFGYNYGTADWYDTTPFYLTPEFKTYLENTKHVESVEILPRANYNFSGFEVDGVEYLEETRNFISSELPYEIASKLTIAGIPPEYLEGELPKDDAYEVVIGKEYAQANGLEIGDSVDIAGADPSGNRKIVPYKIVGMQSLPNSKSLMIGSYQTNLPFNKDAMDDFEHQILYAESNSIDNKVSETVDLNDVYYFRLMVEVDDEKNVQYVIDKIKEYDPYMSLSSNLFDNTSLINMYQKQKNSKQLVHTSIFIILFLLLIILMFMNLAVNRYQDIIIPKLKYYGFSDVELEKGQQKIISSYIIKPLIGSITTLLLVIVLPSKFNLMLLLLVLLSIVTTYMISRIIWRGNKYEIRN